MENEKDIREKIIPRVVFLKINKIDKPLAELTRKERRLKELKLEMKEGILQLFLQK